MAHRSPITSVLLSLMLASCGAELAPESQSEASQSQKRARPNIVFILADDMGLGDITAYNPESKVPTPRLSQLAAEGARFSDAHSPSAVCTPTRYGILTGRYCWRVLKSGVLGGNSVCMLDEEQMTMASLLRDAGYTTGAIGKWHLGLGAGKSTDFGHALQPGPIDFGFDSFFGIPASLDMAPYCFVRDRTPTAAFGGTVEGSTQAREGGAGFWRAGKIADDFAHDQVQPRFVQEAVTWLQARGAETAQGNASPFFLYLALAAPHTPWLPSEKFRGTSQAGPYGDFASMVDAGVGEVLDALEANGFADNTLVVFTSDNGAHWTGADIAKFGHFANGSVRGQKADIHEGGHRVPMIVRWPGVLEGGTVRPELFGLNDWVGTFAGLLQLELPVGSAEDSLDQSALLVAGLPSGEAVLNPPRTELVHHSFQGMFALRSGDWKLVEGLGSGGFTQPARLKPGEGEPDFQLYDLAADPRESVNLAAQMPERVEELSARLEEMRLAGCTRQ
jgi:arylsulfatase A